MQNWEKGGIHEVDKSASRIVDFDSDLTFEIFSTNFLTIMACHGNTYLEPRNFNIYAKCK